MFLKHARLVAAFAACLLLLSSCGLFEGTSIEGKLKRLNRDAQSLITQIQKETDPSRRKTLERDLDKIKDNIEDLLKDLKKEGSKIDLEGMFDDLGDAIKDIGK